MGSLDLVTLPATSAGSTIANTIPNHASTRDKESALRDGWSMAMQDEDPEAGWSRSFFCSVGPMTKNGLSSMWNSFPAVPRMYSASELGDKLSVIPPSARSWIGTTLPDLGRRPMRLATAAHKAVDSDDYVNFGLDSIFGARSSLFPPSFMPSILPPLWFS